MLSKWFESQDIPSHLKTEENKCEISKFEIEKLFRLAEKQYELEVKSYENDSRKKNSDKKYLTKLSKSGTYGDKISALVLLVQSSPLHSLQYLKLLNGLIKLTNRRISIMVIEVIKELFLTQLLPPNRKLAVFGDIPYLNLLYTYHLQHFDGLTENSQKSLAPNTKNKFVKPVPSKILQPLSRQTFTLTPRQFSKLLAMAYFEHVLKCQVFQPFTERLKEFSHDQLDATKYLALQTMQELLLHRPEGELEFLGAIIDKLGDPKPKFCNRACNLLKAVVETHPNMRLSILQKLETFLFHRSNITTNTHAPFYSTVFIKSSINFAQQKDGDLALKVVKIYFGLFKALLKQKDFPPKLMGSIFGGINKAFPYLSQKDYSYEEILKEINIFYEILSKVDFNTSIEILAFLHQILFSPNALIEESLRDRYYKCLFKGILDPRLKTSAKQDKFFALLHRSLSNDYDMDRTKAFFKRLLTLSLSSAVPFVSASLIIMSEVGKHRTDFSLVDLLSPPLTTDAEERVDKVTMITGTKAETKEYDFMARDPRYTGECQGFYELRALNHHFHPTVSMYARDMLDGKGVTYHGDPIKNFAFYNFLENFIHKNPKSYITTPEGAAEGPRVYSSPDQEIETPDKRSVPPNNAKGKKRRRSDSKSVRTNKERVTKPNEAVGCIDFAQDYTTAAEKTRSKEQKFRKKSKDLKGKKRQRPE